MLAPARLRSAPPELSTLFSSFGNADRGRRLVLPGIDPARTALLDSVPVRDAASRPTRKASQMTATPLRVAFAALTAAALFGAASASASSEIGPPGPPVPNCATAA